MCVCVCYDSVVEPVRHNLGIPRISITYYDGSYFTNSSSPTFHLTSFSLPASDREESEDEEVGNDDEAMEVVEATEAEVA